MNSCPIIKILRLNMTNMKIYDNYYVVPVAHKTMGTWAPDILKFMKDLASSVTWNYSNKRGI